ncbi:MarR family winged helix-turn-helix transcriptional regulator [uncultured Allofournierella sp.]|uniref:MarR family winged helix-turn-helix transcriptional regulator n=1 Tax=uncultured Allofournierella sp. TaxID=1940258 RepID=UPI0037520330
MQEFTQSRALELMQAMDRLRRAWKCAGPSGELNKSEFFTLLTLRNKGCDGFHAQLHSHKDESQPMTLSQLAKTMQQTMPAVSQRIRKLEQLGYVERTQDTHDRRTVWIEITPKGAQLLQTVGSEMHCRMERILNTLEQQSEGRVQGMIDSFNCLAEAVQQEFGAED